VLDLHLYLCHRRKGNQQQVAQAVYRLQLVDWLAPLLELLQRVQVPVLAQVQAPVAVLLQLAKEQLQAVQ